MLDCCQNCFRIVTRPRLGVAWDPMFCWLWHPDFLPTWQGRAETLWIALLKYRQANRHTGRQIDRQTGRQTDRQADRQIDRQTDRQNIITKKRLSSSPSLSSPFSSLSLPPAVSQIHGHKAEALLLHPHYGPCLAHLSLEESSVFFLPRGLASKCPLAMCTGAYIHTCSSTRSWYLFFFAFRQHAHYVLAQLRFLGFTPNGAYSPACNVMCVLLGFPRTYFSFCLKAATNDRR